MTHHFFKNLFFTGLLLFSLSAMAEDIDLFVNPPVAAGDLPNLMIVIDNAANFSSNAAAGVTCKIGDDGVNSAGAVATDLSGTVGGIEQCALYTLISGIKPLSTDTDDTPVINIGMMMYNANNIRDINNANCGGTVGGCLVQPLIPLNKANKASLLAWIKSWKTTGGVGNGYVKATSEATGATMQETWAYFSGRTGLSGRSYADIKPPTNCLRNYVTFIGNSYSSAGTPGDSTGNTGPYNALLGTNAVADKNANPVATTEEKALILTGLATSCGSYTFPTAAHENKGFLADEWSRYMAAQNITTYTVGVLGSACKAEYAALLTSMALVADAEYFPTTDYATLVLALETIVSQIQSVNSTFASVSLPISVNTQGTFLNQVYVGMFRPDQNVLPRWDGNLKQYKLGYSNNVLQLLDADGNKAISSANSGFIAECARSFWTPSSINDYWGIIHGKLNCVGKPATSDFPDGNVVEKGAQGYMLRSVVPANRNLITSLGTKVFDTSNAAITKTLLGNAAMTDTERTNLINWARGLNNKGDETYIAATAMRPSVHGDVVHSRPVAISYGANVVVFYGGNDGILRAVNGNRTNSIGTATAGSELWGFVAPEFYSKIKRLYDNSEKIKFQGASEGSAKDYGFDGPVTAYQAPGSTPAYSWIFASMRRGGRALYAFNVTSATSPILKWSINETSLNYGALGQTWSSPKVLKSAGFGSGASPMLIMGGGYDTCHDVDGNTSGCGSNGKKVYVINADDGLLLNSFDAQSSVIADITVVTDSAGLAKYAYTADLGGNVYRISGPRGTGDAVTPIGSNDPSTWVMSKIASLGGDGTSNRKFMFAPDVVAVDSTTYAVLLGSGDREKPLSASYYPNATVVQNRFYMIKDKPEQADWLGLENTTCGSHVICNESLYPITSSATPSASELATKEKGWYLGLLPTEQVVTSAITVFDTVTFSTHQPTLPVEGTCSTLGTATVYNLNYADASTKVGTVRGEHIVGDGLPPSPVAGMVILDDGTKVPFIIGANPKSALQGGDPIPPALVSRPKSRVYWNIKK